MKNTKIGLDYFSFDTDFFFDERIIALNGLYGSAGVLTAARLLSEVYRKGYFLEWNKLIEMALEASIKELSAENLLHIVEFLTEWDFFDKQMWQEHGVLTSRKIQERYFEAVRKRRLNTSSLGYLLVGDGCKNTNTTPTPRSEKPEKSENPDGTKLSSPEPAEPLIVLNPEKYPRTSDNMCELAMINELAADKIWQESVRQLSPRYADLDMVEELRHFAEAMIARQSKPHINSRQAAKHFQLWLRTRVLKKALAAQSE